MGCTASKVEKEDTVRRCKERRRLMKEAVRARHHLAAAHSDYCRSLRVTGSALSNFAAGEPLSVSHSSPAVLLRTPSTTTTTKPHPPPPSATTKRHPTPPPPPSIHIPSPSLHRSPPPPAAAAVKALPAHQRRKKPQMKLPHILSDSSTFSSSPPKKPEKNTHFTYNARANSTFSTTPSQDGSSVWDWENFYPPSPPDSEYFQHLHTNKDDNNDNDFLHMSDSHYSRNYKHVDNRYRENYDKASSYSSFDNHWGKERMETERVEVECSEWGDDHQHHRYSSTSSSDLDGDDEKDDDDDDDDDDTDFRSRSDLGTRSNFSEAVGGGNGNGKGGSLGALNGNAGVNYSEDGGSSSMSWGKGEGDKEFFSDTRMLVRHKDLVEIVAAIKEYFDKAAAAGELVSEMLEAGRAQLDRGFRQLKKTVYHSSGLLSNLSSSWTSKPPLAVKYSFEPCSLELAAGPKSLRSTLDRLFAWEKKLYEDVKAREGVKMAHEKKLSMLQSQEARREEEAKLDKTKASIKRLQSLIMVTSQAVSTTSASIVGLRDSELVPQLVELCHGFMYMWRSMNQFHEVQNDIVQQVRRLVNRSTKESTSDLHRQATRDLESAVSAWHSSFCCLIKFQRDFIRSLHGWFRLTLTPVNNDPNNGKREPSEAFGFCDEWKLALDRIPDTVASEAIKSFINVVHSISLKQTEELKIKKRTESASRELEKKASSLRSIEKKYYNSYSMVGLGLPDPGHDNGHVLDARDPLSEKKAELAACQRRVEDEMLKHSKAVEVTRANTLNNIQTGLPGVFQAMTSFSSLIMEALEAVCTRSYAIK